MVSVLRGDDVYREEGVKTSADSTAKLVLRDNTILTVGPGSFVKLDKFVYDHPDLGGCDFFESNEGNPALCYRARAQEFLFGHDTYGGIGVAGTIFTLEATRLH